jgi:hypothetical protein
MSKRPPSGGLLVFWGTRSGDGDFRIREALLLADVFAADVELTMQALAQDQQCHAVHMEIVSASGTPAKSYQKCR